MVRPAASKDSRHPSWYHGVSSLATIYTGRTDDTVGPSRARVTAAVTPRASATLIDRMPSPCRSPADLGKYLDGSLPGDEIAGINEHLDSCRACRQIVADLGGEEATVFDERPDDVELTEPPALVASPGRPRDPGSGGDAPGPGTMCGEYRLERKIAEGGMGSVYTAVHPLIKKRAAVKLIHEDQSCDPVEVIRFIDEARLINEIGHPNIVDVFAFGSLPDGRPYLVMEWLRGETLRDRLRRGPLEVAEVCAVLVPLVRALEAAHLKKVVHRDLKPENVFLVATKGDQPQVKLLDFGIAKLLTQDSGGKTRRGAFVGTPAYVSPEQASGRQLDTRTDIYALGCMAFEMLTGELPFEGGNDVETLTMHMRDPAPRASSRADVPSEIDDLVYEMMAKAPDDRPMLGRVAAILSVRPRRLPRASATKLDVDPAHGAARGRPTAATRPPGVDAVEASTSGAPLGSPRRSARRRLWVSIAAVTVVGVVAAIALSVSPRDAATAQPPPSARATAGDPATETLVADPVPPPPPSAPADPQPEPKSDPMSDPDTDPKPDAKAGPSDRSAASGTGPTKRGRRKHGRDTTPDRGSTATPRGSATAPKGSSAPPPGADDLLLPGSVRGRPAHKTP